MNFNVLLQKLVDVERSIGVESEIAVRQKVQDAEECLLRLQGEYVSHLRTHAENNDFERFALLRSFLPRNDSQGCS